LPQKPQASTKGTKNKAGRKTAGRKVNPSTV
jgi:hypothetical protein